MGEVKMEAEATKQVDPKKQKAEIIIPIDRKGLMAFTNQQELANSAKLMMQLSFAPDHLKKQGVEAVMAAMVFLKQRDLPDSAMNQCAHIKGKLTQYGSLVTALAERHAQYGQKREFFVDRESNEICTKNKNLSAEVYAAVVQVKKNGSETWNEYFFSVDDARQAGLLTERTSGESGWSKYLKDMLYHKANSRALRAQYASALEGVNYHEDHVEKWDMRDVTPTSAKADLLNTVFKRGSQ